MYPVSGWLNGRQPVVFFKFSGGIDMFFNIGDSGTVSGRFAL